MKQNDFENLFHHQLEALSPDDFPFEESAWDDVESTLDREGILMPTKRKWGGILPFTLLLLVLSNGLVGWKYYNAEQEIQTLNATVLQLENGQKDALSQDLTQASSQEKATNQAQEVTTEATIMPTDNDQSLTPNIKIVEKIVEVPVEKIVEKIVYVPVSSSANTNPSIPNSNTDKNNGNITNNKNITNASNSSEGNTSKPNVSSNQRDQGNQGGKVNTESISKIDESNVSDENTDITKNPDNSHMQSENNTTDNNTNQTDALTEDNTTETAVDEITLTELELIELSNIDNELIDSLNTEDLYPLFDTTSKEKELTLLDRLKYIDAVVEVSNYELGVSSGIDFYVGTDFSMFSYRYGITNELSISEYIKIGATIDWKQTKGELEDIIDGTFADDYFDGFPNTVSTVNPNDLLNKVEYYDRAIEFSLFAKYVLKPYDKFTPYFGAGIKGEYDYQQRFEYYFIDINNGFEYEANDYEYLNNNQLGFNTFIGLLGAEYNLTPGITVRIDGMYNYDYKAHRFDNSQLQWFSGNLGVLYKFK